MLTLVQSILEYPSAVWSPCHTTLINQLDSVQHYTARFIFQDYKRTSSVTNMLHALEWPTLEQEGSCVVLP